MGWLSPAAERIGGPDLLETLRNDDLLPELEIVVQHGWRVVDGAAVLTLWFESYHGDRSTFPEIMDYEVAVNGRGIPDLDLPEDPIERIPMLLRRGAAFAWSALNRQLAQLPELNLSAYVSASPTMFDPGYFTGNVTFCSTRPGLLPYMDLSRVDRDEIVLAIFTEDCRLGSS